MWGRGGPVGALLALAAVAAVAAAPARADSNLVFGFSDDTVKWDGAKLTDPARDVGATALRLTLPWAPGKVELDAVNAGRLDSALAAASGMRIILAVTGPSTTPPLDDTARTQFCTYARSALVRYPSIDDVVIWNEPNLSYFWKPQWSPDGASAAPAAYEALLARCWDILHDYKPAVNVLAPATSPRGNDDPAASSNVSHSPVTFIKEIADAYKASGRQQRIFDGVVQHVYGNSNKERPYQMHLGNNIVAEADWGKLVQTLKDAFAGTAQTVPGQACYLASCVPIWYLESGWQTSVDPAKTGLYAGAENIANTIPADAGGDTIASPPPDSPAPDQATQFRYALRLAYCQPYVAGIFNFAIRDDPNLPGWQSGILWADYTPKPSYAALKQVAAEVNSRSVSCAPPSAPANFAARPLGAPLRVLLSWEPSSSAIGVAGYKIYRNGVAYWQTATGPGFVDRRVKPDTSYTYSVRGLDAAGGVGPPTATLTVSTADASSTFGAVGDDGDVPGEAAVPADVASTSDGEGTGAVARSASVTLRVRVRGHRVTLTGFVRPTSIPARSWHVVIRRRTCLRTGCAFAFVRTVRGTTKTRAGLVTRTLRLSRGVYRFRAVLRDRRYGPARSTAVVRRIGR